MHRTLPIIEVTVTSLTSDSPAALEPTNAGCAGELVNQAFRVFLLGVEDVVGKNGMSLLLRQANLSQYIDHYPPSNTERDGHRLLYLAQINRTLWDLYGARGMRAILQRVGRSESKSALAENAAITNTAKLAIKLMNSHHKVRLTLDTFARTYSQQTDSPIQIREEGEAFYVENYNCGQCMGWQSETPVCFNLTGMIHGVLAWALESADFKIEETECCAKGDVLCRYRVTLIS